MVCVCVDVLCLNHGCKVSFIKVPENDSEHRPISWSCSVYLFENMTVKNLQKIHGEVSSHCDVIHWFVNGTFRSLGFSHLTSAILGVFQK